MLFADQINAAMKFRVISVRLLGRFLCWPLLVLAAVAGRAQVTETPETVPAGHFLLKVDALSIATNIHESAGGPSSVVAVGRSFLTAGLTSSLDVQVGADVFISQKFEQETPTDRNSGFGDLYLRAKWTFWRDGRSAVAFMPYVQLPTSTGDTGRRGLQGGVIVPWATYLPGGAEFRAMAQVDLVRNAADDGYDASWTATAALVQPLTSLLKFYGEATVGKTTNGLAWPGTPWAGTIGGGVQLHLASLYWWEFAVYRGIARGAPGWNPVVRVNWGF